MRMTAPGQGAQKSAQSRTLPARVGTCPMPQSPGVSARCPWGHRVPGVCQGRQGGAPSSAKFQERPGRQHSPGLQGLPRWSWGRDPRLLKCLTWASTPASQASLAPSLAKIEEMVANHLPTHTGILPTHVLTQPTLTKSLRQEALSLLSTPTFYLMYEICPQYPRPMF